jgi:hypothetical protein
MQDHNGAADLSHKTHIPVIATLGEAPESEVAEVKNVLGEVINRFNRTSSDTVRAAIFDSLILSMLMNQADPQRALYEMMTTASSGIVRAKQALGQGGTG